MIDGSELNDRVSGGRLSIVSRSQIRNLPVKVGGIKADAGFGILFRSVHTCHSVFRDLVNRGRCL